jgi:hypothetical protein
MTPYSESLSNFEPRAIRPRCTRGVLDIEQVIVGVIDGEVNWYYPLNHSYWLISFVIGRYDLDNSIQLVINERDVYMLRQRWPSSPADGYVRPYLVGFSTTWIQKRQRRGFCFWLSIPIRKFGFTHICSNLGFIL